MKDEGLIRHVGLSNVSVEQLDGARDIVDIATVQNRFNLSDRDDEDVLEACERYGIGFIPWFPLGAGDLGGVDGLDEIAQRHDATPYQSRGVAAGALGRDTPDSTEPASRPPRRTWLQAPSTSRRGAGAVVLNHGTLRRHSVLR